MWMLHLHSHVWLVENWKSPFHWKSSPHHTLLHNLIVFHCGWCSRDHHGIISSCSSSNASTIKMLSRKVIERPDMNKHTNQPSSMPWQGSFSFLFYSRDALSAFPAMFIYTLCVRTYCHALCLSILFGAKQEC